MERKKSLVANADLFHQHVRTAFRKEEGEFFHPRHLPYILGYAMQVAGEETDKRGQEKKEAIVTLMRTLFKDFPVLVDIVPGLIELLLEVQNGRLVLNPRVEQACSGYLLLSLATSAFNPG